MPAPRKHPPFSVAPNLALLTPPLSLIASSPGSALPLAELSPVAWQTFWLIPIAIFGLMALAGGFYALRNRRLRFREKELEELVNSRTENLQREIATRQLAQQRTSAFSRLGQQLSLPSTQTEIAQTIVDAADQLIGWDSCSLFAYSPLEDRKYAILGYDIIDGKRSPVPLDQFKPRLDPLSRRAVKEGAQLLLREDSSEEEELIRFGDVTRSSASLLFAPIRNGAEVVGILSIQSYSPRAYDSNDLDTLQTLADYCGGAFARILQEEANRKSQPRLFHQERLAAIGELSAGAAHEFNNILTVVQGNSSILLSEADKLPGHMREALEDMTTCVDRAANLTRQLLTFSRKQYMRTEVLDLNRVVEQTANMLQRLLGESILIETRLSEDPAHIRADAGMMSQILVNLAVNARQAMPKGGRITLRTDNVEITRFHPNPEARPGEFTTLTVSDTGCGMDTQTLSRIFEPFFTTKGAGEKAGLGLASVYGIVKQHKGWIEVESQVHLGTTFTIFLPATDELPAETCVEEPTSPSCKGSETILLVEDEPGVRNLVRSILRRKNYVVLEAANALEALEIWRNHRQKIDLLLTDIVLPEQVSGWDLADQLRTLNPELPVIYTSGYAPDVLGKSRRPGEHITFLAKPYPPNKLVNLVHQCLHDGS